MKKVLLFSFTLFCLLLTYSVSSVSAQTPVSLYDIFETTVTNNNLYTNPFDFNEIELTAEFTAPSGKTVNFFGFYDGDGNGGQTGSIWKLRFMPDEVGQWSYSYSWSDGTPGGTGTFNVTATGARPGPLKKDPANNHWFMFADGSRAHLHGYYYLDFYSDLDAAWNTVTQNVVVADGYNVVMPGWYIRGTSTVGANGQTILPTYAWVKNGNTVDWTRFNLATWKRLDERIGWAADNTIVIYTFDGLFPNIGTPVPTVREDQYIKYTIARHAPFWNILWNTCFECGEKYTGTTVKGWVQNIKNLDPWDHPVSWHDQSTGQYGSQMSHNTPEADYASLQTEFRTAKPAYNFMVNNYFQKPVMGTETNWEECSGVLGKPRNGDEVRKGMWGVALGSGIPLYADWAADYCSAQGDILHYGFGRGRPYVKMMNQFLNNTNWSTMVPRTDLVSVNLDDVAMANPGSEYIVYSETGSSVTINLTGVAGTFNVRWFNPRDGTITNAGTIDSGGNRTLSTPDTNDWVLHITKSTSNTITESFENGFGGWTTDHEIHCENNIPDCAQPFIWHIQRSTTQAQDGIYSLEYFLTGANDDGTTWIMKEFRVPPGATANIDLSFYLWSPTGNDVTGWPVMKYIGERKPEYEIDFDRTGRTGEVAGWKKYDYIKQVTSSTGSIYIALGISVTWEADRTYFIDNVSIVSDVALNDPPVFSPTPTPTPVPGDVDDDGDVDISDLSQLLASFGGVNAAADFDGNGTVGIGDLAILLSKFGT